MAEPGSAASPTHSPLEGVAEYEAAIDTVIASATRTLRVFDRSVSREFNSIRRYEVLRSFLLASRSNRLYIVVHEADGVMRDCPRLINLLRQFSHGVVIRRTQPRARRVYDPFTLADESNYVHRFHYDQPRAALSMGDLAGAQELLPRFEEIWDASDLALNATTLGL